MPRRRSDSIRLIPGSDINDFDRPYVPAGLPVGPLNEGPVIAALGLIAAGLPEEEAARSLTWKDFERFCAQLLRAGGYDVRENVYMSRPRGQIDLVASGPIYTISMDCKHWKRAPSARSLESLARAQLRRSRLLRRSLDDPRPIVSAILSLSDPSERFVGGVAIVPLRVLRDFLDTVESYSSLLEQS